ncbi:MAG: hypothetical protein L6R42_010723 [Xanthoria sp. 1 TBL-2021]|nr:MAG: hypothetical protein L6R42_010723 [Xanthoria sp. 1 TBL-2021]
MALAQVSPKLTGITNLLYPNNQALASSSPQEIQEQATKLSAVQEKLGNISDKFRSAIEGNLKYLMRDAESFARFADTGKFSNDKPPLETNDVVKALATTLQTYIVSEFMRQTNWYAVPLEKSTKEEYDARKDPSNDPIYWSPATLRQYRLAQKGKVTTDPSTMIGDLSKWADLPLLFDGAYNCTAQGQADGELSVYSNYDGTLDLSCPSSIPVRIACGASCPDVLENGSCLFTQVEDCKSSS